MDDRTMPIDPEFRLRRFLLGRIKLHDSAEALVGGPAADWMHEEMDEYEAHLWDEYRLHITGTLSVDQLMEQLILTCEMDPDTADGMQRMKDQFMSLIGAMTTNPP